MRQRVIKALAALLFTVAGVTLSAAVASATGDDSQDARIVNDIGQVVADSNNWD